MLPSRLLVAAILAIFLAPAAALEFSGTVLGVDKKPLAGVEVKLSGSSLASVTDAAGAWKIETPSTRIAGRDPAPTYVPRAMATMENGRLRVRYDGRDLAGRGNRVASIVAAQGLMAARAHGLPDTLSYSQGGEVRLRDTVSALRTGIVRVLDTTFNPVVVYGYLTDSRDERDYRTVRIGTQIWMAENLDHEVDGSWWFDNSEDSGKKYGRLYTWAATLDLPASCNAGCASLVQPKHQGICPDGWHIPSDAEWDALMTTIGGSDSAAKRIKSRAGWFNLGNGTDAYGFRAMPGGYRHFQAHFDYPSTYGYWWSATDFDGTNAWFRFMKYGSPQVFRGKNSKDLGLAARCVQD